MDYFLKPKRCEFAEGYLISTTEKKKFNYKLINPKSYGSYNGLINGMEFAKATVSIETSDELPFQINDRVKLADGGELKIADIAFKPIPRTTMYGSGRKTYILNLV